MLSFHAPGKNGIEVVADATTIPSDVSWIDAERPDARDIAFLERTLKIEVPTLEQPHKLKIPEGIHSGAELRIRHKGVAHLNGHARGDVVVHIEVKTPTKLTKDQRRLFEQLRETLPADNQPAEKGIFEKVKDYFV